MLEILSFDYVQLAKQQLGLTSLEGNSLQNKMYPRRNRANNQEYLTERLKLSFDF